MKKYLALLALLPTLAMAEYAGEISAKDALKKINDREITAIDVRSPEEFAQGHIPGAINIPHNALDKHQETLAKLRGKPILLYCRSGRRAGMAEAQLAESGFNQVYHLTGDMLGWQEQKLPEAQ